MKQLKTALALGMILLYSIIALVVQSPNNKETGPIKPHQELVYANFELTAPGAHTIPGFQTELIQFFSVASVQFQAIDSLFATQNLLEQLHAAFLDNYLLLFRHYPLLRLNTERLFPFHFFL